VWNDLRRFCEIPQARKRLLGEALLALAVARVAMACIPFRKIAGWLGTPGAATPATATAQEIHIAQEIGWAVEAWARRVPWDSRCLAQALAATALLRRRGLEGTVSFGGGRIDGGEFSAHAWLRLGSCMVTGGPGHDRFKIFTTFSRRRP
jgi:hypothetical protein